MNKVIWFRYDLRLIDNEAFSNAVKQGNILPIFIFDKDYFKLDTSSSFHVEFIKKSTDDLDKKLQKEYGSHLNIYYGDTLEILKKIIDRFKISEIYSNKIFKNKYLTDLDTKIEKFFLTKKIKWNVFNQFGVQLNHRERYNWSNNWNQFINTSLSIAKSDCKFIFDQKFNNFPNIQTNKININLICMKTKLIFMKTKLICIRSKKLQRG